MARHSLPSVLCLAGLDATGGAGLQADIEAVASMGAHALPVLTANTVQNTRDVVSVTPVAAADLLAQGRAVIDDIAPDAVKVGLLADAEVANAVVSIIDACPGVPVVVDPVCASGAGTRLADDDLLDAIAGLLIPRATIVTPNTLEVRLLAPESDSPRAGAQQLLSAGASAVLVTGTHASTHDVRHHAYSGMRLQETWSYPRLPGEYHGSGCTLSAALAALLAHGLDTLTACKQALDYTHACLRTGLTLGGGQMLPDRLYWSQRRG
jgi:hydroxymethylpyrimidine/phosphomethylpyrimidine kinase